MVAQVLEGAARYDNPSPSPPFFPLLHTFFTSNSRVPHLLSSLSPPPPSPSSGILFHARRGGRVVYCPWCWLLVCDNCIGRLWRSTTSHPPSMFTKVRGEEFSRMFLEVVLLPLRWCVTYGHAVHADRADHLWFIGRTLVWPVDFTQ